MGIIRRSEGSVDSPKPGIQPVTIVD